MTCWFFLASVNLLITSVELEVSSGSYDVQAICHASSVLKSQTGGKKIQLTRCPPSTELPDVSWVSSACVVIKRTYVKLKESGFSLSLATSNHSSGPNSLLCYAVTLLVSIELCWCRNNLKER